MKVTVCEMNDSEEEFPRDWDRLVDHVQKEKSDLKIEKHISTVYS